MNLENDAVKCRDLRIPMNDLVWQQRRRDGIVLQIENGVTAANRLQPVGT